MVQMSIDAWAEVSGVPADTPLVLAGFSMGGYVALQMLADAPRRVPRWRWSTPRAGPSLQKTSRYAKP